MEESRDEREKLVLICVDACEHSLRAFDWYYKYFYRDEHTIGLVQVYTGHPKEVYDEEEYERRLHEALKKSDSISHAYKQRCAARGMKARVFTVEKDESVGHTICKLGQEKDAVCIVIGPRGFGAVKRAVYGSVSNYVLHHAGIAVLVVPPRKDHLNSK